MNCPSCGAPMRLEQDKDYLRCDYCKNLYFPKENEDGVRVLGELSELLCPVCSVPLIHAALYGCRILYCDRCRGLLVSMDFFVELTQELRAADAHAGILPSPPDPKDLERHTDCPQCHRRMDTHYYAGPGNIVIDDCSFCHLNWLDYGELQRITRAPGPT
jgi:Zn-finger nucleic acid-binding protein